MRITIILIALFLSTSLQAQTVVTLGSFSPKDTNRVRGGIQVDSNVTFVSLAGDSVIALVNDTGRLFTLTKAQFSAFLGTDETELSGIRDTLSDHGDSLEAHANTIYSLPSASDISSTYLRKIDTAVNLYGQVDTITYLDKDFSANAWGSDWDTSAMVSTYSFTDGLLEFTGTGASFTNRAVIDTGVMTENNYVEATVVYQGLGGTTVPGIGVSFRSYRDGKYYQNLAIVQSGQGRTFLRSGAGLSIIDNGGGAISIGDTLKVGLRRSGYSYYGYTINVTQGWTSDTNIIVNDLSGTHVPLNSHNVCLNHVDGAWGVVDVKYYDIVSQANQIMVVGNSITLGQDASTIDNRWASLLPYASTQIFSGGGGDVTESVVKRLGQIIALEPRYVYMMIGGNDILYTYDTSVWRGNYRTIRNTLSAEGIKLVHLLPTPRTVTNELPLKEWIESEYTGVDSIIDTYTPLLGSGTSLAAEYDSGDGVHPNDAGMALIAETISTFINAQNIYSGPSLAISTKYDDAQTKAEALAEVASTYVPYGGSSKGANQTVGTNDNYNLSFETNGTRRMTIFNDGNVAIGTNANPSPYNFEVALLNSRLRDVYLIEGSNGIYNTVSTTTPNTRIVASGINFVLAPVSSGLFGGVTYQLRDNGAGFTNFEAASIISRTGLLGAYSNSGSTGTVYVSGGVGSNKGYLFMAGSTNLGWIGYGANSNTLSLRVGNAFSSTTGVLGVKFDSIGRATLGNVPTGNVGDSIMVSDANMQKKILGKYQVSSSAATLTLTNTGLYNYYTFSGTTTTWTLPTVAGNAGAVIYIKNIGSGDITLNSNSGANDIYLTSATNSITIGAGEGYVLWNNGTYYITH